MGKQNIIFILIIAFYFSKIYAQNTYIEISPWEPGDIQTGYRSLKSSLNDESSPFVYVASKLIKFYQKEISKESISRCPFYISCSNYAYYAIKRHGLIIGMALFIDRNLYRENVGAYLHYNLRETEFGVLKLDDTYYLFGKFNN